MSEPRYITVRLPFHADGIYAGLLLSTAWLSKIVAHRVLGIVKGNTILVELPEYRFLGKLRRKCYDILPNRRYVDGVLKLVYSTIRSAMALGVDVSKLELKQWLLFQSDGEASAKGNNNIRLLEPHRARILVFSYDRQPETMEIKLTVPKGYRKLVEELVRKAYSREIGYPARVYISDYGIGKFGLHVAGELQVMVPYQLYCEVMKRYDKPLSDNIAGIDVNVERLDVAIVSPSGRLRRVKTFWLDGTVHMGIRAGRAWSLIGETIHEMLEWLYHSGVSTIVLENPEVLGYLRYYWIRNGKRRGRYWNWKVSMFRTSIIERIAWKTPLYSINVVYIDPKGTTSSREHGEIMRKYGLDRHTASAYLIALKELKTILKSWNTL